MHLSRQLLEQASNLFPECTFVESTEFKWSPTDKIITYCTSDQEALERLLHEIGHAKLRHTSYDRDIKLIAMERDAWEYAKTILAPQFDVTVSAKTIQNDLDTYRDWLHARSSCPHCKATGIQTGRSEYTCVVCKTQWHANAATNCGLRRYTKPATKNHA